MALINHDHVRNGLRNAETVLLDSLMIAPPLYSWLSIASDRSADASRYIAIQLSTASHSTTYFNNFSSTKIDIYKATRLAFSPWKQIMAGKKSRMTRKLYQKYLRSEKKIETQKM